jgi:23S rRNA (cytidine1920-2'-O)/16S rRNA (cytidine1409-2'-O)-methyltransferase
MKKRADIALVEAGLAPSRSQARLLIEEGVAFSHQALIKKPSEEVGLTELEVRKKIQYVGRGGHKLEGALDQFDIDPEGRVCADFGASTGGFTHCLLLRGASRVYALDVGHDQLAPSLKNDSRVINREGVNCRHPIELAEPIDLVVADLSYISLRLVLPTMMDVLRDGGQAVVLVKPQFETEGRDLSKQGVVKTSEARHHVLNKLWSFCLEMNYAPQKSTPSPILGKTGNVEYFFLLEKGAIAAAPPVSWE